MRRTATVLGISAVLVLLAALPLSARDEPEFITVQHILIGFKRSMPDSDVTRTKKEAKALAMQLFDRARAEDADFDALVEEYTDDRYPGIYPITNRDAPYRSDAMKREDLAMLFGDVAFGLEVGEVGLARYNSITSPFGWHIIKRLE